MQVTNCVVRWYVCVSSCIIYSMFQLTGGVPMFVGLLSSEHKNVVDQAVWALGNIAGDGTECRDFTIKCGIIQPLLALIKPNIQVFLYVTTIRWKATYIRTHMSRLLCVPQMTLICLSNYTLSSIRLVISVMSLGLSPTCAEIRILHPHLRPLNRYVHVRRLIANAVCCVILLCMSCSCFRLLPTSYAMKIKM